MSLSENYFTILKEGVASFEEKKSTFIGSISRARNEEEAREYIKSVKEKNKEARHNVFGYVIGDKMQIQRCSDDGEPQGTGGVPVLEVIKKNNIKDCVIVVTRYFGGILLGTGGLTRAYSKGASMALSNTSIVQRVIGTKINIEISYDLLGKVQYLLEQNNLHIEQIIYEDRVTISLLLETKQAIQIKASIINLTSNKCIINIDDEKYYLKLENRLYCD